jgi:anthranilate phosphoribosyltransferase
VVHGEDGLDEITTVAKTHVYEAVSGKIKNYQIHPDDFGIKKAKAQDLSGGNAADNARILIDILQGKAGPKRDIVVLNSGCAIYAADRAKSIKEGIALASESIDSGSAYKKFELLREYSLQNG